jgi:hypothetical protein
MSWIKPKSAKLYWLLGLVYVLVINPYTAALIDPNAALSKFVSYSIYISYFIFATVGCIFFILTWQQKIKTAAFIVVASITILLLEFACFFFMRSLETLQSAYTTPGFSKNFSVTGRPHSSSIVFKSGKVAIEYNTNSFGFRDIEWNDFNNTKSLKIALFGDSFTEGWGVKQEEIIAYRLRKELPNAQILNFGLQGSGPGFARCIYSEVAQKFKPDVIVFLSFMGNDFVDSVNELENCITNRNPISSFISFPYTINLWKLLNQQTLDENKVLLQRIRSLKNYEKLDANFKKKLERYEVHLPLVFHALQDPYIMRDSTLLPSKKSLNAYKSHIEKFIAEGTKDNSTRFIIILIPVSTQVSREQFDELTLMGFLDFKDSYGNSYPQDAVAEIVKKSNLENKIFLLDLHKIFSIESSNKRLYLEFDNHINSNGHLLIARELAKVINRGN